MIIHNLLHTGGDSGPDYLFESSTLEGEFLLIEDEMKKLNDYCVICDRASTKEVAQWDERYKAAEDLLERVTFGEEWWGWTDVQETVVAGMTLILLTAFVEKQLKVLCDQFGSEAAPRIRTKPGQPKAEAFFQYLRETIKFEFDEPPESKEIRILTQQLRNQFAHGDWDEFRGTLGDVDLSRAFGAVTALFRSIEGAYADKSST